MQSYRLPSGLELTVNDNLQWAITDDWNTDYLIIHRTTWTRMDSYFTLSNKDIVRITNILLDLGVISKSDREADITALYIFDSSAIRL